MNLQTIYHYHGSCAIKKVVDIDQIIDFENTYIGDLSVSTEPIASSTSVSAMLYGYRVAEKIFIKNNEKTLDLQISQLMNNIIKNDLYDVSDIVKVNYKHKKLEEYIKLQNSYVSLEDIININFQKINQKRKIKLEKYKKKELFIDKIQYFFYR